MNPSSLTQVSLTVDAVVISCARSQAELVPTQCENGCGEPPTLRVNAYNAGWGMADYRWLCRRDAGDYVTLNLPVWVARGWTVSIVPADLAARPPVRPEEQS